MIKYLYAAYLYHFGLKNRVKYLKEHKLVIAIYDHNPTPKQLEKYIQWLLNKGFEFISLQELEDYLNGKTVLNNSRIWFTLDDGWRGNLKLLPVMEKYNIPITIFIPTNALETGYYRDTLEQVFINDLPCTYQELFDIPNKEREQIDQPLYQKAKTVLPKESLNVEELKALAKHPLISLGLHTHTHPSLVQCTNEEIKMEVEVNKIKLMDYAHVQPAVMAVPYGRYNDNTLKTLSDLDVRYVATSDPGVIVPNNGSIGLPRNGMAKTSFYENCCRMLDFWYPNVKKLNSIFKL